MALETILKRGEGIKALLEHSQNIAFEALEVLLIHEKTLTLINAPHLYTVFGTSDRTNAISEGLWT